MFLYVSQLCNPHFISRLIFAKLPSGSTNGINGRLYVYTSLVSIALKRYIYFGGEVEELHSRNVIQQAFVRTRRIAKREAVGRDGREAASRRNVAL